MRSIASRRRAEAWMPFGFQARRTAVLTWLGFAVWALVLAGPFLAFGPDSYVRLHDSGDAGLPIRIAMARDLSRGELGFWSPWQLCGTDSMAFETVQSVLDATLPLFALLPGWLAHGLLMWAQRFVAGIATYYVLRRRLALSTLPSVLGALGYATFFQPSITMAWDGFKLQDGLYLPGLPLVVWVLGSTSTRTWRRAVLLVSLAVAVALTSSAMLTVFILVAVVFWFVAIERVSRRQWLDVLLFVGVWLLAESPGLWAVAANVAASHRADWIPSVLTDVRLASGQAVGVRQALGLLRDNGVWLAVGMVALVATRVRERRLAFALGGVASVLTYLALYPLLQSSVLDHLPIVRGLQADRLFLAVPFFSIVAGALGLDQLRRRTALGSAGVPRLWRSVLDALPAGLVLSVVVLTAGLGVSGMLDAVHAGSTYAAMYMRPELAALATQEQQRDYRIATLHAPLESLSPPVADLPIAQGFEVADGYSALYPQRYQDLWARVIEPKTRHDAEVRGYFSAWGNRVYLFAWLEPVASARSVQFSRLANLDLLSLLGVRYLVSPVPIDDARLTCVSATEGGVGGAYFVYGNRAALPRAFLTDEVRVLQTSANVLDVLSTTDAAGLRREAVVCSEDARGVELPSPASSSDAASGRVDWVERRNDTIRLVVATEGARVLVVTQSFSPYWKAFIDGRSAPLFPADHAFQGIVIPDGTHEVSLEYSPPYKLRR